MKITNGSKKKIEKSWSKKKYKKYSNYTSLSSTDKRHQVI
jgi:hypothetical protein